MDELTCDSIDRIVSVEVRYGAGLPRGVIHRLHEAARGTGKPLTWQAADALRSRVKAGDHVLVVTGAGSPPWLPQGETDGPLGAAAIARAIEIGLGAKPVLVTEERNLGPLIATVEAAGLACVDNETFVIRDGCALAVAFPLGTEAGLAKTEALLREYAPAAVIFVEKGGPNSEGIFHSILGTGRGPEMMANAHLLAAQAQEAGVLTIGIGDGGNEIGFGRIAETVRKLQPYGRKCQCPCGAGVATVADCDILVVGGVSNWAAYGVAAALAGLLRNPDVLHDSETERRMLERCVEAGAMDGAIARLVPMVDGTSAEFQTSMIAMLREIVEVSLKTVQRGF